MVNDAPAGAVRRWLQRPVDGASLAAFRIGFGLTVIYLLGSFLVPRAGGRNWIDLLLTGPETRWHFPYPYLTWIRPLPEPGTTLVFLIALGAAICLTLGLAYRVASSLLLVAFSSIWLMDASLYGNHFPLTVVFLACLAMVPAARAGSIDAWLARRRGRAHDALVPWWAILLLRVQTGLVYFYGGVAKLHADWFAGEPLRMWLAARETVSPVERVLGAAAAARMHAVLAQPWAAWFFSYGGLIFDLTVPLLLAWRRTRVLALVLMTGFHAFNFVFIAQVGLVAVMAFWATLIFCEPDWPRRFWPWHRPAAELPATSLPRIGRLKTTVLCVWIAFQVLWPLRQFLIAGDAYWTDEGTRASWFLMTRNKTTALAQFRAVDPQVQAVATPTGPAVDWQAWRGMQPPVELIDVDARQVVWASLPEVFATYEPLIGERLFYNPEARGISTYGAAAARANELWLARFGRRLQLTKTESLEELLDQLGRAAIAKPGQNAAEHASYLQNLAIARTRLQEQYAATDADAWLSHYRATIAALDRCQAFAEHRPALVTTLVRCAPLGLQGYRREGLRPLLIGDAGLVGLGHRVAWRVQRDRWPGHLPTYGDTRLLEARYWRDLPSLVPIIAPDGSVAFLWNYTHELNDHQIEALELLPPLAGPLAQHIADWWQQTQRRRPRVYGSALVALNRRPLLQVFDPTVDIAAEPYRVWRHNPWITLEPPRTTPRSP
ncbi:MAG: HTTM domain-containing protein [Pirellulales bacterium]|nr:HTTM domain-containing protein [Pirellulales bacterium]